MMLPGLPALAKKAEASSDPLGMMISGGLLSAWTAGWIPMDPEDALQFGLGLMVFASGARIAWKRVIHKDSLASSDLEREKREG